jgi:hypothetical protein
MLRLLAAPPVYFAFSSNEKGVSTLHLQRFIRHSANSGSARQASRWPAAAE